MTLKHLQAWLDTVRLGGPFAGIRLEAKLDPDVDALSVVASWTLPCVDTGLSLTLYQCGYVPAGIPESQLDRWLYQCVLRPMVEHELQEQFRIGDVLVIDPHRHERKLAQAVT